MIYKEKINVSRNTDIQELISVLSEILEMSDEFFEQSSPVIFDEILRQLSDTAADKYLDSIFIQLDQSGESVESFLQDLKLAEQKILDTILSFKEKYPDGIKNEFIDKFYSIVESYFSYISLRTLSRDNTYCAVEFCHPNAKLPTYAHAGDQGADVYAVEDVIIPPHSYGNKVPTGLKIAIPHGWAIAIRPRSGLSMKTPLRISNSPATIDQLYRGEIAILFDNFSNEAVEIKTGDRIAQFILEKNYSAIYHEVDFVDADTERSEGGFGSSGK